MKRSQLDRAIRRALTKFDEWNDVTGFVVKDCGYYGEFLATLEDAVHCGAQEALEINEKLPSEKDEIPEGEV